MGIMNKIKNIFNKKHNFRQLNDLVSYGVTGKTLHIHLVPESIKNDLNSQNRRNIAEMATPKMVDALDQISEIFKDKENLEKVFAVSPILKLSILKEMFGSMGFEVSKTTEKYFLDKFPNAKEVFQAQLSREKLLSGEYKKITEKSEKTEFVDSFKDQVENSTTNDEVKKPDAISTSKEADKEEVSR